MEDATPEHPAAVESVAPEAGPSTAQVPVVGLGASAGGLQALQTFFDHTAPDSGMAFVVILHLAPDYESQAADLLQAHTAMPVTQVTGAVPLAQNHVYVIPPAKHLLIAGGHLRLAEAALEQDQRAPIDHFFRTLADTHARHATAIILSGTGSDGTVGLKRVKEQGGAIFVQDPQEAQFDGMPRSAIATGLVDFVLPVAAMPEMLIAYWRRAPESGSATAGSGGGDADEASLREILALLRVRTNHDFSQYKRPTILRRVGRRLQVTGVSDLAAYLDLLRNRPEEVQALLQDLLISVTNFFRDREAWAALQAIVPLLFAGKGPEDQVRVWVTACATREEAYTVGMLLLEHARTLDHPPAIQIFATDIDDAAIRRAREGSYPETIAGDVSPERLRQFFVLEQGRYCVKPELREVVLFAQHNILRDPPFSKLDLITCRNLLIYLNHEAQEQVIRLFHFSLRPGGYLLLGTAESLDHVAQLFDVAAKGQRLFKQRAYPAVLPPALPARGPTALQRPPRISAPEQGGPGSSLDELHRRLALRYAPPSVIVNEDYEIVHLSPGAGRFLVLQAGEPSYNLLRVAHPDLRLELRAALLQSTQLGTRTESRHIRVTFDDIARLVDVVVEPIQDGDWPGAYLFVLFVDAGPAGATRERGASAPAEVVQQLEAELERTRERLQMTVEEYETAGEEYKAANEELTAINEELRAAGEELETSKEELQAVNEELQTVNQELKARVDEGSQANNDLQNLIAVTEIATLFLDSELHLTRYTPSVERIFNLIPTDLHRPFAHITHTLRDDRLVADAQEVLATLQPIEREVASTTGQWYLMQQHPYRTLDDHIAGVVISFIDITERKRREAALAEKARLLDLSNDAIIVRDVENRIIYWNHGAAELYGWTRAEALGQDLHGLLRTEFEIPLEQLLIVLRQHDRMEGEVVQVTRDGRRINAFCRWALDRDAEGRPGAILTTYNDITERKRADAALRESEARYRTLFESIDQGFCIIEVLFDDHDTPCDYRFLDVNPAFEHQTGLAQVVGKRMRELAPQLEAQWFAIYGEVAVTGTPIRFQQRAEALHRWFDVYAIRIGEPISRRVAILFADITERKRAEAALRASEERLRLVLESVQDYAIFTVDTAGRVTSWNEGAHHIKGYTTDEIVGQSMERFFTPEDVAAGKPAHALETALREGRSEDESWRVRKDGSRFWANEVMTPLYADDGRHLGFTTICRDLTVRKQAEDAVARALVAEQAARGEAEAALETRNQFLSIASHELRTPLTPLLGYTGMLQQILAEAGDERQRKLAEAIERQVVRLNTLIGTLLDVSRLQRGQFTLERRPLDLAARAAQVVDDFRLTLPRDGARHTLTLVAPDAPVPVLADAHRLEEVLHNLLGNAVKYSPKGGAVRVQVARQDGEAVLEVADEGIGIPAEAQAHLFEPFYRAGNVGLTASGFGLGLYIVHEIVERHGGRMEVESAEGRGTVFRVVLPLHGEQ